jgi:hypothetical protein
VVVPPFLAATQTPLRRLRDSKPKRPVLPGDADACISTSCWATGAKRAIACMHDEHSARGSLPRSRAPRRVCGRTKKSDHNDYSHTHMHTTEEQPCVGMSGAAWSAPAVGPRRCARATALSFHVMVAARHSRILARLLFGTPIAACACSLRCAYARAARATCRCASVERAHGTTQSRAWTEAGQLGLRLHFVHAG